MNRNGERVHGGRGFITEVAGRDRVKFFRRPVEQEGSLPTTDTAHIHFAASYSASQLGGTAASGRSRPATMNGSTRNRPHRLPRLQKSEAEEEAEKKLNERSRAAGTQTGYRENEAQTDPYSPNYFIPDDMPEPEILKLQGLKWKDGLPVGQEEVELIQRLRRRRAVEAQLPTGKDDASIEKRYAMLHQLEEEEWKDREEHVEKLQKRRLDKIEASLMEREAAREEANQRRLDGIKQQQMSTLRGKLTTLESRRMADSRRAVDQKLMQTSGSSPQGGSEQHRGGRTDNGITYGSSTRKRDLIESYVKYGKEAAPPQLGNNAGTLQRVVNYDVRPAMLGNWDNVEEVDAERGVRIERVGVKTFDVPVKEAIKRLPTLYQRHEAERVLDSLEYAHNKIQEKDAAEETRQHVLDLYRATPKVQRPDTPVLELDGDDQEEVEEACILLQRLLRGRAVQNDYFEGKERCRGLIEELQAASNAKYAQRSLVAAKEREELIEKQEAMVQGVLHVAQGDIISDTLGYLFQELEREQDIQRLDALRVEAEAVRQDREVKEIERREEERVDRDREEVQYAAFVRSTDATIHCFLHDVFASAVDGTALAEAVMAERNRQAALPPPMDPPAQVDKENLVCDMLDGFVLPTVVDFIDLRGEELDKKAPAGAALDVARSLPPMNSPPSGDEEAPME